MTAQRENSATLRKAVHERDHGLCAWCGFDADKFDRIMYHWRRSWIDAWMRTYGIGDHATAIRTANIIWGWIKRKLDIPENRNRDLWDAHHTKQVFDGGAGMGLDNIQTVCLWCHREQSSYNAKRNAKKKRREKRRRYRQWKI